MLSLTFSRGITPALVACGIVALGPWAAAASTNVSGTITTSTTWTTAGSPYIVVNGATVGVGATLTIQPGVVVKLNSIVTQLAVRGMLVAIGTPENRIIFTSLEDDSVGGDSGGDGATVGAPGQWQGITVYGSATFQYVDARYGGWGSANAAYGAVQATSGGSVTLDHCNLSFNQRAGIVVDWGSYANIAHSQLTHNAIGASVSMGVLQVHSNSSLSDNSDTGVFMAFLYIFAGTPSSVFNSDIKNNLGYGVRLIVDSTVPAASMPRGSYNNIHDNGVAPDQRQLASLYPAMTSDWGHNYWGPVVDAILCPWAPPNTSLLHLTYEPFPIQAYCKEPGKGPTTSATFIQWGCPDNKPMMCASDFVKNTPYALSPYDNSAL